MLYKDKKEHGEQKRKTKERNGQEKKGGAKKYPPKYSISHRGFSLL